MHAVTVQQTGIRNLGELAGKRVSVGSPGSATEVMPVRILEAYGIDESVKRGWRFAVESVNALKTTRSRRFSLLPACLYYLSLLFYGGHRRAALR
jgi:uncharacterized protein